MPMLYHLGVAVNYHIPCYKHPPCNYGWESLKALMLNIRHSNIT